MAHLERPRCWRSRGRGWRSEDRARCAGACHAVCGLNAMSVPTHDPVVHRQATETPKYFFVQRPVLAGVISIVIVLLGTFAMLSLPVNRYPQITPPAVQVTAIY